MFTIDNLNSLNNISEASTFLVRKEAIDYSYSFSKLVEDLIKNPVINSQLGDVTKPFETANINTLNVGDISANSFKLTNGGVTLTEEARDAEGNYTGTVKADYFTGNAATATKFKTPVNITFEESDAGKKLSPAGTSIISGSGNISGDGAVTLKLNIAEAVADKSHGLLSAEDKRRIDLLLDYRAMANSWSQKQTFTSSGTVSAGSESGSGAINVTNGGIWANGGILGSKVYNAVWNDLVDCIPVDNNCELYYGYCYCFDGTSYHRSKEYLEKGIIGIHSDTYGMHMGYKKGLKQMNVAVAGFVLAYVDKEYESGTPLTCGKDGYLTEIKEGDKIKYPERIVGTFWKKETEKFWGSQTEKVVVGGRSWVRIK